MLDWFLLSVFSVTWEQLTALTCNTPCVRIEQFTDSFPLPLRTVKL